MSDIDELRWRVSALERDLSKYHDALEEHLYDTEVQRVERSHGWLNTIFFVGGAVGSTWLLIWLDLDAWFIEIPLYFIAFFGFFGIAVALTDKPMKREIERIRKPLSYLPKPRWRENNE